MSLDAIKQHIPDYAKDIKLNLSSLLGGIEPSKLPATQIAGLALAAAYASGQTKAIQLLESFSKQQGVSNALIQAIKAAASLMAMNNVYYRSVHGLDSYQTLPSNLRMHMLQKHGIVQQEFELYCVVISSINGCQRCLTSHISALEKGGVGTAEIQYSLRLAAVIKAFSQVLIIEAASS